MLSHQKGDRFLLPSIVKRPSTTGSELPDVVDAACAARFQQTIDKTSIPFSCGHFCHASRGSSFQRWWRAGRGRGTEQEPRSVMRCKFQPRACIAARSFLLEGRSGSSLSSRTGLLASRSRNSQAPAPPCGGHANPLRAARARRRIYAGFGPIGAFQSRPRVSTWHPFIWKGEFVFLFRREQNHRFSRVPSSCCRRHLL